MASQLGCVCRMAAHEGHRSGFCDTVRMGTNGNCTMGMEGTSSGESRRESLAQEGAFVAFFAA